MRLQRVKYRFSTPLGAPRTVAYRWATDYSAGDLELGGVRARRRVERLTEGLVLLTDSFDSDPFSAQPGTPSVKKKLVHLYPEEWAWTATHVAGPAKYSQFLYRLTARGPTACRLDFTGSQVEEAEVPPTAATLAKRARTLRREDSQLWTRFAAALARDVG